MKDFKHIFSTGRLAASLVFTALLIICTPNAEAQTLRQRNRTASQQTQAEASRQTSAETALRTAGSGTATGPDGKPFIYLHYKVIHGDTVFVEKIRASKCYSRLPRQKSKEWRKYYRLVHNFAKAYPYALASKKILLRVDSTIVADGMKRGKRDKYINQMQKELFKVFEEPMRSMTVSQGALLMKLIDREIGKTSFNIIKDYKNGMAAGFWQGIAKLFGSDMKKPYDPDGDDRQTEELVKLWQEGEFDLLYFAIFMKEPPRPNIPAKYR